MDEELPEMIKHGIIPDEVFEHMEKAITALDDHLDSLKNDVEIAGSSMRVSLLANVLHIAFCIGVQKLNGATGSEVADGIEAFLRQVEASATRISSMN